MASKWPLGRGPSSAAMRADLRFFRIQLGHVSYGVPNVGFGSGNPQLRPPAAGF
jgi:hypothetical protein